MMKKFFTYSGLVAAMILWAFTFIWAKQVMNAGLSPTMLIFFRLSSVAIILLPWFYFSGMLKKIERKDVGMLLLMSFFEPFLYFIGEANGIQRVSPNIASIIIATIPLFLPFFARIIIKEKLKLINYFGIAVSFSGVLLIIIDKGGRINTSTSGLLFLFMAVFSAVGYTLIAKKLLSRYSPFFISGIKIFIAWVYFIPVFFIVDFPVIAEINFSNRMIILILALGLCGNLLAYYFFNNAIKVIGASKASIFSNLIPVFTVFLSFILLHEHMPLIKLAGIGLAICGIFISQLDGFRKKLFSE
jgi:drug/metabolite transporter (DMT)-like permease